MLLQVYAKPVDEEQKNEFQEIDKKGISSLWKIRRESKLEHDYRDSIMKLMKEKGGEVFFLK